MKQKISQICTFLLLTKYCAFGSVSVQVQSINPWFWVSAVEVRLCNTVEMRQIKHSKVPNSCVHVYNVNCRYNLQQMLTVRQHERTGRHLTTIGYHSGSMIPRLPLTIICDDWWETRRSNGCTQQYNIINVNVNVSIWCLISRQGMPDMCHHYSWVQWCSWLQWRGYTGEKNFDDTLTCCGSKSVCNALHDVHKTCSVNDEQLELIRSLVSANNLISWTKLHHQQSGLLISSSSVKNNIHNWQM